MKSTRDALKNIWRRFSPGFIRGSLLGLGLATFGLLGFGIAVLTGLEKDKSMQGVSLLSLYVLSFGLGGGTVTLLRNSKSKITESVIAWALATMIVMIGCAVIAGLIDSHEPINVCWGILSSAAFLILFVSSILGNRLKKRGVEVP